MTDFEYPGIRMMIEATCKKRETTFTNEEMERTLNAIEADTELEKMWNKFQRENYFVGELSWKEVSRFNIEVMKQYLVI